MPFKQIKAIMLRKTINRLIRNQTFGTRKKLKYCLNNPLVQFMAGDMKMGDESTLKGQFGLVTVPKGRLIPSWYWAGSSG